MIALTGQANLVREQKAGELEAILTSSYASREPSFRSMAWEGDTVYEQWRDLNFGSWKGQLDATGATTVLAQFGQVESFDGKAASRSLFPRTTVCLTSLPPARRASSSSPPFLLKSQPPLRHRI
ncbi:hypothetical protein [Verrucomicrobium spinosum]|uniref:hypothetical protein n=1 Tax=Verrucomicrobium spinosum TaxID=2736 RepID=UPI000ADF14A6|nr:hypothetical protein [Verrucomicrobium spinosum]